MRMLDANGSVWLAKAIDGAPDAASLVTMASGSAVIRLLINCPADAITDDMVAGELRHALHQPPESTRDRVYREAWRFASDESAFTEAVHYLLRDHRDKWEDAYSAEAERCFRDDPNSSPDQFKLRFVDGSIISFNRLI